jgi:hypothetical protein
VRDGKVVDFKFQSTGDPELDQQIRRQLDKFKKKVKLPSNAKKDGEVRANVNFGESKSLKQSEQARNYLERQARERRGQTATRQSGGNTTSSVIERGVDVPAASSTSRSNSRTSTSPTTRKSSTGRSGSTTFTPTSRTSTPVRRTRVRRTQSTSAPTRSRRSTSTSEQRTPTTSTPIRRTPVKRTPVRRVPTTSTPANSAPSSSESE